VRRGDGVAVPAPDVLKIDVEGHESAVLDGLGDYLNRVEAVLVEVHEAKGVDRGAIRGWLEAAGLTVEELATGRAEVHLGGSR